MAVFPAAVILSGQAQTDRALLDTDPKTTIRCSLLPLADNVVGQRSRYQKIPVETSLFCGDELNDFYHTLPLLCLL